MDIIDLVLFLQNTNEWFSFVYIYNVYSKATNSPLITKDWLSQPLGQSKTIFIA